MSESDPTQASDQSLGEVTPTAGGEQKTPIVMILGALVAAVVAVFALMNAFGPEDISTEVTGPPVEPSYLELAAIWDEYLARLEVLEYEAPPPSELSDLMGRVRGVTQELSQFDDSANEVVRLRYASTRLYAILENGPTEDEVNLFTTELGSARGYLQRRTNVELPEPTPMPAPTWTPL